MIRVGKLVLNRNPENFFAEVEQAAFAPGHMVPGIEPSNDKLLQGRLFSYPDAHRHRLGVNSKQIPVNCPYMVNTYQRDGPSAVNGNGGASLNYEPNSFGGPVEHKKYATHRYQVTGYADRTKYTHPNDDFSQVGIYYSQEMTESERTNLVDNIASHLKDAQKFVIYINLNK